MQLARASELNVAGTHPVPLGAGPWRWPLSGLPPSPSPRADRHHRHRPPPRHRHRTEWRGSARIRDRGRRQNAEPPGCSGSIAAISGTSLEVQNAATGQTTVTYTPTTTFDQTVPATASSVTVGSLYLGFREAHDDIVGHEDVRGAGDRGQRHHQPAHVGHLHRGLRRRRRWFRSGRPDRDGRGRLPVAGRLRAVASAVRAVAPDPVEATSLVGPAGSEGASGAVTAVSGTRWSRSTRPIPRRRRPRAW